jgi:hypothetical protein
MSVLKLLFGVDRPCVWSCQHRSFHSLSDSNAMGEKHPVGDQHENGDYIGICTRRVRF